MEKHSIKPVLEHYGLTFLDESRIGWVKVKCPFHNDSHASAAVNVELNQFKCFACQAGGDTYKIIMDKEGIEFREAVAFAETISGASNFPLRKARGSGTGLSGKPRNQSSGRGYKPPRGRRGTASRP